MSVGDRALQAVATIGFGLLFLFTLPFSLLAVAALWVWSKRVEARDRQHAELMAALEKGRSG